MVKLRLCAPIALAVLLACTSPGHPGPYHGMVMRGQVVEAAGSDVYICIGSADGAKPGQKLRVYRITRHHKPGTFLRETTGMVRIDAIVDEHFAKGTVISGTATTNNMVELDSE
jgi:hypothetical protein